MKLWNMPKIVWTTQTHTRILIHTMNKNSFEVFFFYTPRGNFKQNLSKGQLEVHESRWRKSAKVTFSFYDESFKHFVSNYPYESFSSAGKKMLKMIDFLKLWIKMKYKCSWNVEVLIFTYLKRKKRSNKPFLKKIHIRGRSENVWVFHVGHYIITL